MDGIVRACPKPGKVGNQTLQDGDKQFKLAVACVWVEWLNETSSDKWTIKETTSMNDGWVVDYKQLELDHIKNKTHGNRYDLLNAQLITPQAHREKHDSGEYIDYRPKEYVLWLKEMLK